LQALLSLILVKSSNSNDDTPDDIETTARLCILLLGNFFTSTRVGPNRDLFRLFSGDAVQQLLRDHAVIPPTILSMTSFSLESVFFAVLSPDQEDAHFGRVSLGLILPCFRDEIVALRDESGNGNNSKSNKRKKTSEGERAGD